MTVKELKAILNKVANENTEVSYFDYSSREINGFYYSEEHLFLTNLSVQPRTSKDEV